MSRLRSFRPSAGVVLGTLALIVAVAGSSDAFAGPTIIIHKGEIAKGAVTAKTLAPAAVHPKALAPGAVGEAALRPGAVSAAALGPDAVTAAALKPGAVTSVALKPGAVGATALGPDAVGSSALAPASVYGGALGPVTLHSAPIPDTDAVAENGTWTISNSVTALCSPGERVLSGGVVFTDPGNHEVAVIGSVPFSNGASTGFAGRITSNSGGTAAAEVQALCLK